MAIQKDMGVHGNRVQVRYELPLNEIVTDFHDKLKSATRGYGSFDYELVGFRPAALQKLDVLVNGDPVDALSLIVHKDKAFNRGSELTKKLKEFIPRQQFPIAIQAAIGSARDRADDGARGPEERDREVLRRGHLRAKRKLLEKQKAGKKRMKMVGSVRDSAGGVPRRAAPGRRLMADGTQIASGDD